MQLTELGWLQYERKQQKSYTENSVGRISVENKTNFVVQTSEGELQGIIQGKFRHETKSGSDFPKVGDWVAFEKLQNEEKCIIHEVLPRYSIIARKSAGESTEPQIIAANVDTLFIVYGLDKEFNAPLVERYLSMAYEGGVEPILILNKIDSIASSDAIKKQAESLAPGLQVHAISAINQQTLPELEVLIEPGRTLAFVGPSGVGKSTIINSLIGSDVQSTGAVRLIDSKGRHTTTRREMFTLPNGGILIDTPGIRELETLSSTDTIRTLFSDIELLAQQCRFKNCDHINSKHCAVLDALHNNTLSQERYDNFIKLSAEAAFQDTKEDIYKRLDKKKSDKRQNKALREAYKTRKPQQKARRS